MFNRVKAYREHHRWSQAELARKLGVSRQTIIAIERGKFDPSLRLAFKLSQVFAVPLDLLFVPNLLPPNSPEKSSP